MARGRCVCGAEHPPSLWLRRDGVRLRYSYGGTGEPGAPGGL